MDQLILITGAVLTSAGFLCGIQTFFEADKTDYFVRIFCGAMTIFSGATACYLIIELINLK